MNTTENAPAGPTVTQLSPSSRMGEVVDAYPGARRALFRKYHLGGCSSCAFSPDETLGELCARSGGLDPQEILDELARSDEADRAREVVPAELDRMRRENVPHVLVDIRTREEWDAVHLEGATFFTMDSISALVRSAAEGAVVIMMDHQGDRAPDAAAYLEGQGIPDVRVLRGGIDAWSTEVDPRVPRYALE